MFLLTKKIVFGTNLSFENLLRGELHISRAFLDSYTEGGEPFSEGGGHLSSQRLHRSHVDNLQSESSH